MSDNKIKFRALLPVEESIEIVSLKLSLLESGDFPIERIDGKEIVGQDLEWIIPFIQQCLVEAIEANVLFSLESTIDEK